MSHCDPLGTSFSEFLPVPLFFGDLAFDAKGKRRCLGITLFELDRYASLHPDLVMQVHDLINMIQKELPQAGELGTLRKAQARETLKNIGPKVVLANAGYDSEESHRFAREEHGIRTIIPNRV